jgi:ATP-dependent DNA helicase RecG
LTMTGADRSDEIKALLAQGMGATLHWFPVDVPVSRLAATLVGMANTRGGSVLVGVAPRSAQIQGVQDAEEVIDRLFQAALLVDPPLVLPLPLLTTVEHAQLLWVSIPAGLPCVYNLDGRYLGREGSQTNPLPARRLRQLLMERGVLNFEAEVPLHATLDDLDPDKVAAYVRLLNLPGDETPEQILLRRGCLRLRTVGPRDGGAIDRSQYHPTYAALLLFGRHPQQWLPNAGFLAVRFLGDTLADHFVKQEINGTLPEQLRQAEAFLRDHLHSVVRLVGLAHQETLEYPLEAVRELLVNAVAHRDYNVQGDNIHVHLFADHLEVHSPGGLPGPMNLSNLLEARFSRNAVVMQVLADMGFVERLGYGLNRVMEVVRQNNLRLPQFEEIAGTFRVTLYAAEEDELRDGALETLQAYQQMELTPRQELALNYLMHHRRITNREYQDLCPDVHSETLRRDLVDLVERSVLVKIGDKRATYYVIKK